MRKALTWTFSGFFRSLGRALFWLFVIIFLSLILSYNDIKLPNLWSVLDVNADTIKAIDTEINDTVFNGYSYVGNSTNNSNVAVKVGLLVRSGDIVDYPFLVVDFCVPSTPYIDRRNSQGNGCNNSCFSNLVQKQKIAGSCKTNGQTGQIWRATTQIVKYSVGTQYDSLDDSFYVSIPQSGNNYISVYGIYITNDSSFSDTIDYTQNFNNVINNQNQNTQDIMNNQNQNTQDIMNNQNQNTQSQIDSQKVCQDIDKNAISTKHSFLNNSGEVVTDNNLATGVTDFININKSDLTLINKTNTMGGNLCFYNVNKSKISCILQRDTNVGNINIPVNTYYFRATINENENLPTFKVCKNGNQAMQDTMTNDDSSGASNEASSFFDNFSTNTHGLTGIITAPLNAINSLTSQTCTPLVLPLPFVNQDLTLPCMRPIYEEHFSAFMQIYDIITLGIISYWVMVRIFSLVKDFKNPEHDEVEVLDL